MVKRRLDDDGLSPSGSKKRCHDRCDRLSALTDELLLRVLSFLPVPTVALCQQLSSRFCAVAGDSQLWKGLYYNRFILPRDLRLYRSRSTRAGGYQKLPPSRMTFFRNNPESITTWKQMYKIRHNWSRGSCAVKEVQIDWRPTHPQLLIRLRKDVFLTADLENGLRVWSTQKHFRQLARMELRHVPTCMEIQSPPCASDKDSIRLAVGFAVGKVDAFEYDAMNARIRLLASHHAGDDQPVKKLAFSSDFIVTMTESSRISLLKFELSSPREGQHRLQIMWSLSSQYPWSTSTLALRTSKDVVVASVIFARPAYPSGWLVGIQEMLLRHQGGLLNSRLGVVESDTYRSPNTQHPLERPRADASLASQVSHSASGEPPTTVSYSHPYLLLAHSDNTLTFHLVRSTESALSIGCGRRLFGHTSSVSGAQVRPGGTAVSVSKTGDELRIWDLERLASTSGARQQLASSATSVPIVPESRDRQPRSVVPTSLIDFATVRQTLGDRSHRNQWVDFNEERVIVLRRDERADHTIVSYDFT